MKTSFISLLILICFYAESQSQISVHFKYQRSSLSEAERKKIEYFVQCNKDKKLLVTVAGHTNNTPNREVANLKLSLQRANAVVDFLKVLPCKIRFDSVGGYGGRYPKFPNTSRHKKALNRRVELRVASISFTLDNTEINNIDEENANGRQQFKSLYDQLATPPETFCIDNSRDTTIVGRLGTIVQIKKGDLMPSVCKCVTISLNEYFDKSEMIFNNLSTTSDGNQLESGGMIKIEATCNGKIVELAYGKSIGIMVPTDSVLPGMKLFTAERDSSSEILNWSSKNDDYVDDVDYLQMYRHCSGYIANKKVSKCPLFFCRINRFFSGFFKKGKWKTDKNNNLIDKEQELIRKYAFDTTALAVALAKSKGNNKDILKYYAFQNFGWGYRNVDRYRKGTQFNNLYVEEVPKSNIDTKFIEKNSRSIVPPGIEKRNRYLFSDMYPNQIGWAVCIKLPENKILLSIKLANSSDKNIVPEYKEVTIDEFKKLIKLMDVR